MATMKWTQDVFSGPSEKYYDPCGSVSYKENVTIKWQEENDWFYIEYDVDRSSTTKKRGYVPKKSVSYTGTYYNTDLYKATRYANHYASTYYYPAADPAVYAGYVANEAVTYLGLKENNFAFIQYNVSGEKRKRAYVWANDLGTAPAQEA